MAADRRKGGLNEAIRHNTRTVCIARIVSGNGLGGLQPQQPPLWICPCYLLACIDCLLIDQKPSLYTVEMVGHALVGGWIPSRSGASCNVHIDISHPVTPSLLIMMLYTNRCKCPTMATAGLQNVQTK